MYTKDDVNCGDLAQEALEENISMWIGDLGPLSSIFLLGWPSKVSLKAFNFFSNPKSS